MTTVTSNDIQEWPPKTPQQTTADPCRAAIPSTTRSEDLGFLGTGECDTASHEEDLLE